MRSVHVLLPLLLACGGCASVVNEPTQKIRVDTRKENGQLVMGARCTLSNDRSSQTTTSGFGASVRRSASDLDIVCTHPHNPTATARATSHASAAMFGNLFLGGGIGAIIDHERGVGYSYPTWLQLVFGRDLVFDRDGVTASRPAPASLPLPTPMKESVASAR